MGLEETESGDPAKCATQMLSSWRPTVFFPVSNLFHLPSQEVIDQFWGKSEPLKSLILNIVEAKRCLQGFLFDICSVCKCIVTYLIPDQR